MSVSSVGIDITNRFFSAIDILKSEKKIRGLIQISEMYGLNYGNLHSIKTSPQTYILKPEIIANFCLDFGISTEWILLGTGDMFKSYKNKRLLQKNAI